MKKTTMIAIALSGMLMMNAMAAELPTVKADQEILWGSELVVAIPAADLIIDEEMTVAPEQTPAIDEEMTVVPEQTPAIDEEMTVVPEQTPAIDEEMTVAPEQTPAIDEEMTVTPEETPAIDEEMMVEIEEDEVPLATMSELREITVKHILVLDSGEAVIESTLSVSNGDTLRTEVLNCVVEDERDLIVMITEQQQITIDETTTVVALYYAFA